MDTVFVFANYENGPKRFPVWPKKAGHTCAIVLFLKGADLYTQLFSHTQQIVHYSVVQYKLLMHKLLCMAKKCCVQITTLNKYSLSYDRKILLRLRLMDSRVKVEGVVSYNV